MNRIHFVSHIPTNADLVDRLISQVRENHHAPMLHLSVHALCRARTVKLCGIFVGNTLACYAWYMFRNVLIYTKVHSIVSIGLVTTLPEYRGLGLATRLIHSIEGICRGNGGTFAYLQGIPGFYSRIGYHGIAPKSKFIFTTRSFKKNNEYYIRQASLEDAELLTNLYEEYAGTLGVGVQRSESDWEDLLGPLSRTFLFHRPSIVLSPDGVPAGYFCTSPDNNLVIREFVTGKNIEDATICLNAVSDLYKKEKLEKFEIFSPDSGPVANACSKILGGDFIRYLRPDSSNLIKSLVASPSNSEFIIPFIFQGDNL
jgi:GNAT superfamily N-acetyltransferase